MKKFILLISAVLLIIALMAFRGAIFYGSINLALDAFGFSQYHISFLQGCLLVIGLSIWVPRPKSDALNITVDAGTTDWECVYKILAALASSIINSLIYLIIMFFLTAAIV